jgi:hypothetical protein
MSTPRSRATDDDDEDAIDGDNPGTFPHEGRGEELDPAVSEEEWTDRSRDQLDDAVDVDDPVEALEEGALWAATEAGPSTDATELADQAAPLAPEEAALVERLGISPEADDLTVGLPAGSDLDLGAASVDDLLEAELVAIDEGDPETAAILADELERLRRAGS